MKTHVKSGMKMSTLRAAGVLALAAGAAAAAPPAWEWQAIYGGPPLDQRINGMVQTADGGYIAVGEQRPPAAVAADILVLRLDAQGNLLWSRLIDGGGDDTAISVVQTADGGYAIAGDTTSVAAPFGTFLLKLSPAGGLLWARVYGGNPNGAEPRGARVIETANNDLVVASRANFGNTRFPTLMRTLPNGAPIFQSAYMDSRYTDQTFGAFVDVLENNTPAGGPQLVAVGHTGPSPVAPKQTLASSFTPAGAPIVSAALLPPQFDTYANSVTRMANGDLAIAGRVTQPGVPEMTYFLRCDPLFNLFFVRSYQDIFVSRSSLWTLRSPATAGADFLMGGWAQDFAGGQTDAFLMHLDAAGAPVWAWHYGGPQDDRGHTAGLADDGFFVAGDARSFGAGDLDAYAVKTNGDGESDCFEKRFEPINVELPPLRLPVQLIQLPLPTAGWQPRVIDGQEPDRILCRHCPADLNDDGLVDFSDYLLFLNLYALADPDVDFNRDGFVDFSDYLEFLNFYALCS